MQLGSIEVEAAACRAAFAGVGVGALVRHCHHDRKYERLTEDAEHRISYILREKPEGERALRLRLFRPQRMPDAMRVAWATLVAAWATLYAAWATLDAEWAPLYAEWDALDALIAEHAVELDALHAVDCPDCPWDGKSILGGVT